MYTTFTRARLRLRWNFLSNRHGTMAILFALTLIPLGLAIGFALDISRASSAKSDMQNILDAAAIAAAIPSGVSDAKRQDIGARTFTAQYSGKFGGTVSKTTFVVEKDRLVAFSRGNIPSTFMRLAGKTSMDISAKSEVMLNAPEAGACVVFKTFSIGGSLRIDPKCGFHTYDTGSNAFLVLGSFANYNSDVSTAGGFRSNPPVNSVKKGVPPMRYADPVGNSRKVSGNRCTDHKSPVIVKPGTTTIISPGTYCHKLKLNGGELHLRPGVYVLQKEMEVRDRAILTGSEVVIVFTHKARFRIDSGDKGTGLDVWTTAPRSGIFKDILIYQAPSAADNVNYINGSLDFVNRFSGLVYLPDQDFIINGALSFKTNKPAAIVGRNVDIRGAMHVYLPDDSLTSLISGGGGDPYLMR